MPVTKERGEYGKLRENIVNVVGVISIAHRAVAKVLRRGGLRITLSIKFTRKYEGDCSHQKPPSSILQMTVEENREPPTSIFPSISLLISEAPQ